MPVHRKKNINGPYYQWGNHGKKYYYKINNEKSRKLAKDKAKLQGRAIKAREYSHYY
jgi:hypothetical protein